MEEMEQDRLITPSEAAALFGVNPKTITRWARAGVIKSVKTMGGHRRYRLSDVINAQKKFQSDGLVDDE